MDVMLHDDILIFSINVTKGNRLVRQTLGQALLPMIPMSLWYFLMAERNPRPKRSKDVFA
jgi:hypothetical protein